jgi:hypothetical protein
MVRANVLGKQVMLIFLNQLIKALVIEDLIHATISIRNEQLE